MSPTRKSLYGILLKFSMIGVPRLYCPLTLAINLYIFLSTLEKSVLCDVEFSLTEGGDLVNVLPVLVVIRSF